MATTGAKLPTAAVTAAESPWLDNDWTTPEGICGAGTANVTAATYDAGDQTYVLKAQGFDFSAIPVGSTINGVTCVVNGYYATAAVSIDLLQLLDTTGAKVGTNQAATPIALTTGAANYTKGGAADKWGLALDAAWVKNVNFGVALGCLAGGTGNSNNDVYIDSVTLEIDYTPPASIPYSETFTATVGLTGSPTKVMGFARALEAALGLTGVPAAVKGMTRSVDNALGLADATAKVYGITRTLAATLGLTSDMVKRYTSGAPAAAWAVNVTIGL
jgi:hypothetical protein